MALELFTLIAFIVAIFFPTNDNNPNAHPFTQTEISLLVLYLTA
jgi:hypothetical protein